MGAPDRTRPASNPRLFIVQFPGSISGPLDEMLELRADFAIHPEVDWIVEFYETWTGLNQKGIVAPELVNKWVDQGRFDRCEVGREPVKRLFQGEKTIPFAAFLTRLFDLHGMVKGKSLVGVRCGTALKHLAALHALWPEAKFVHVIRDGRDACLSFMDDAEAVRRLGRFSTWAEAPVSTIAQYWARRLVHCREQGRALGPAVYHEVRHEAVIERPDDEWAGLSAFLGAPHDPAMVGRHVGRSFEPSSWRARMPGRDVELFEAAAGELLEELDYPRAVPSPSPEAKRLAAAAREAFDRAEPGERRLSRGIGRRRNATATNPYVFVVGCPRSGTTLLQRVLDAHPDVAICPETFWIPYYFKNRVGLAPDGTVTEELSRRLFDYYKFYRMKLGWDHLMSIRLIDETISYSAFVSRMFDLYGEGRGKPLVGDKTPDYVRNIPTLHGLWPNAKFVHLIRDGRDVGLSATQWKRKAETFRGLYTTWGEDPVSTAALWWEWHVRLGREGGRALDPSRYLEIRYETLVANPDDECARLCAFLGLAHDPAMLRFHEGRTASGLDAKGAWLPVTAGLRDWRTQTPAADVERFEAAAGGLLEELGYPRADQRPTPEAMSRAAALRDIFERDARSLGDRLP